MQHSWTREIKTVLALAGPVALAELGWVSMAVVDTIMVGNLGPTAIGAIAIGSSGFYAFAIFGLGLMLGLDTLVSRAYGAGDRRDCHRSLSAALYLAVAMLEQVQHFLPVPATDFLRALSWSTLPLLLYGAFRRYLQATGHVAPVTFAIVTANLVNWFGNWVLIYGRWGVPALGVRGSALSTVLARIYVAVFLGGCIWVFERSRQPAARDILRRFDPSRVLQLVRIGLPAATQILLEIGAFGAVTFLAGRLAPVALAAHQIAINIASVSFMAPLGMSSAAAVLVGHAVGRQNGAQVRRHGSIAFGITVTYELCAAAVMFLIPLPLLKLYTADAEVLAIGTALLGLAALFQLFDGLQTVATGALRGLGDTRTAMLVNLCGYWLFGLPLGYALCFYRGYGVFGLWVGLTVSLMAIALVLTVAWRRKSRNVLAMMPALASQVSP